MIDTKMKTMVAGLGLVAMLGGCDKQATQTRVIDNSVAKPALVIENIYVPLECAQVTGFSATGNRGAAYGVIECIDTQGYRMSCIDTGYCLRLMEKK